MAKKGGNSKTHNQNPKPQSIPINSSERQAERKKTRR